ncbi:hypothetical protein [Saccharothrix obliqua]|uniref:hypothetical protein n=1 Tax=Saccharothrix obliqua TaxID=2861747 RepID=UPI001C5EB49F|nr:hypothetical protein [Saccharothrix obliqua]MBW4720190.1 hypothetical protein [Saccharothrix obliqua]
MTYPGDGQSGWGGQSGQQNPGYGQQGSGYQPDGGQYGYGGVPQDPQYGQPNYGASYGGLGVFSGGQEPPRKKSNAKLWVVIGVVALLLVGGGLTAYFVTRPDESQPVAGTDTSTPTTTKPTTTTKTSDRASCEAAKAGWNCLPVESLSYRYDVPKAWTPNPQSAPVEGMDNVKLTGLTVYGVYECGGSRFNRGSTGGVVVPQTDLTTVAKDFAQKLGAQYYQSAKNAEVKLSEPKPVKVPNGSRAQIEGVQVDATITTSGSDCLASQGMVKVLVLKGTTGYHVFMANGDLAGGPATPKPATEADLQAMVDSVQPLSR